MSPERAEMMLVEYRECVGRRDFLQKAIPAAEADIAQWKAHLAEDLASSGGVKMDGMPHGTTVGRVTERLALMLAGGWQPEGLTEAEEQLERLKDELQEKALVVMFVEAWMSGLTTKERWLIEQIYFERMTYAETATAYTRLYGVPTSRDGIRRMRKTTIGKIFKMAE